MKQFLQKINFQKYSLLYTVGLGILAYCVTVLHFTGVYWKVQETGGSVFAPVHLPGLIVGIVLGVLFLISLILRLSGREKKEVVIPTAQPGLIYGYLKLTLVPKLENKGGVITGELAVANKGGPVRDLSSGSNPVNVGISIVDANKEMVDQEYKRLAIKAEGLLDRKETVSIPVRLEDLAPYAGKGYFLAFTLVQEFVAWDRSSAVYFPID